MSTQTETKEQYYMEDFKKRKPCPYGVLKFDGLRPDSCYVVHTLVIDDKYVMEYEIHPLVRRWINKHYVDYEPYDWKTINLIVC